MDLAAKKKKKKVKTKASLIASPWHFENGFIFLIRIITNNIGV